jgi:hypothetical protein
MMTYGVVGIASRLRVGQPRNQVSIPRTRKIFFLLHNEQTGSEDQPVSYPMDTGGLPPPWGGGGVNGPGREADQSPPSSA